MSFDEEHLDEHYECEREVAERDQRIRELEAENERLLSLVRQWSESCTGRHGSQSQCVESCSPLSDATAQNRKGEHQ